MDGPTRSVGVEGGGTVDDGDPTTVTLRDGRRVSYAEYGVEDGTPVLFLHGTPGSRLLAALFDDAATRHGVRLVAPDRPGYGRSSPWAERPRVDTGEFLAPVLDDADVSRAGVVGFSGGGPHALAFAATHGERVVDVDVVSGATPPSLRRTTPRVQRLLELAATRTPRLLRGVLWGQRWLAARAPPSFVVSQYTTADGRAALSADAAHLVRRDFVEALARERSGAVTESRLLARDWGFSPERVTRPVRLWHGACDSNVPVDGARRLAERLPEGRITVFEDADHLTTLLAGGRRVLERHGSTGDDRPCAPAGASGEE